MLSLYCQVVSHHSSPVNDIDWGGGGGVEGKGAPPLLAAQGSVSCLDIFPNKSSLIEVNICRKKSLIRV